MGSIYMIFKKIRPKTSSLRHLRKIKTSFILTEKVPLLKSKLLYFKNISGRNNTGQITVFHKGNGHKKKYRIIDFKRNKNSTVIVISIEYDPYRNSFISAVYNTKTLTYNYILTPKNLRLGNILKSGTEIIEPKLGFSTTLNNLPIGTFIHNISVKMHKNGQFIRSAGTYAQLIEKKGKNVFIRLNGQRNIIIPDSCFSTVGRVSNEYSFLNTKGKAGRTRWLNIRPTVRGVAMNPIDHPNG